MHLSQIAEAVVGATIVVCCIVALFALRGEKLLPMFRVRWARSMTKEEQDAYARIMGTIGLFIVIIIGLGLIVGAFQG
jgi:hypothetical protein